MSMANRIVIKRGAGHLASLTGRVVLLVEDSVIIALDLEDLLKSRGAAEVLSVATIGAGREILAHALPDVALLDINLGAETSIPLADDLQDRRIPYLFLSGYGVEVDLTDRHRGAPRIGKPIDRDALLEAIDSLLRD